MSHLLFIEKQSGLTELQMHNYRLMIVRTFKATIYPGKNEEFKTFFTQIAIPLVKQQEGLIDLYIGLPMDETSSDFIMTSFWKDINSIKKFSGEQWQNAVIDDREKHLVQSATMEHYYLYGEK